MGEHQHVPVYAGVVNVRVEGEPVGYVDVWECTKCGMMFAEERRFPPREIVDLGFREPKGTLAIAACRSEGGYWWTIVDLVEEAMTLKCGEASCKVRVPTDGAPIVDEGRCDVKIVYLREVLNRNLELTELF